MSHVLYRVAHKIGDQVLDGILAPANGYPGSDIRFERDALLPHENVEILSHLHKELTQVDSATSEILISCFQTDKLQEVI
jgi:hypothetical protein